MNKLSTALLISAYSRGYFPMPDPESDELLWFHPEPRAILPLDGMHISRSFRKTLRRHTFDLSINKAFPQVIAACADRDETWINDEFIAAYTKLHREGFAHSVEVWSGETLVGGLYGVSLAGGFFAESMFHYQSDASKIALHYLVTQMKKQRMSLLEIQFITEHLKGLGAIEIPRAEYMQRLEEALSLPTTLK